MFDSVQTLFDHADKLSKVFFRLRQPYEYRDRVPTGTSDRDIDFVGTEVFKLFRGRVYDRRGYLGDDAS